MKLLIVDDSEAMRLIVRRGLDKFEQETFSIKQATCGKDALAIIGDWQPDIILSDWHMPNMTGLELISIIKQRKLPIKVGIVTSEKKKNRLQQALDQGAEFILPKPFKVEELHNAVLPLITRKKKKSGILTRNITVQSSIEFKFIDDHHLEHGKKINKRIKINCLVYWLYLMIIKRKYVMLLCSIYR